MLIEKDGSGIFFSSFKGKLYDVLKQLSII